MAKHVGKCPQCGHQLDFDTAVGEQVACSQCGASLRVPGKPKAAAAPADPLVGQTLGEFVIEALLGRGGMGAVYRGTQPSLGRPVAIKVLPQRLASNDSFIERFHREARAAAAINHPNIIEIYSIGQHQGHEYIAMEFVAGESLRDLLKREGRLEPDRALELMKQVADALSVAHAQGILHRDIKPDNILLTKRGRAKVADFGLAKQTDTDVSITVTGQALGTPLYIPPEAAHGAKLDARSDLYSLGATFYHLMAGRPPFEGASAAELIIKHDQARVPPLQQVAPDVHPAFARVVHRLLRKKPDDRYADGCALLEALKRVEAKVIQEAPTASSPLPPRGRAGEGAPEEHKPHTRRHATAHRPARKGKGLLIGGIAGAAALVVVLVIALGGREDEPTHAKGRPPPGKPPPPIAKAKRPGGKAPPVDSRLERNAALCLQYARQCVLRRSWRQAQGYLDQLRAKYGNTEFAAANRAAIAAVQAQVAAALEAKAPRPAKKASPAAKKAPPKAKTTPTPPVQPTPPPDDDGRWTEWEGLFDGKTLSGWTVATGQYYSPNVKADDANGQILLDARPPRVFVGMVRTPAPAAADYELELEAARLEGNSDFGSITFPVAGGQCALILGGSGTGDRVGLDSVDGVRFDKNETATRRTFEQGRWYRVRLRVAAGRIEAWIDDTRVVDIATAGRAFAVARWGTPTTPFGLHAAKSLGAVRNIRLRRLKPAAAALPPADAPGWRSLFDGRTLDGWEKDSGMSGSARVVDGWIEVDGHLGLFGSIRARNVAVRATIAKPQEKGRNVGLLLRAGKDSRYAAWITGEPFCGIGEVVNGKYRDLAGRGARREFGESLQLMASAIGDTITLYVDGKKILETRDRTFREGRIGLKSRGGAVRVKDIAVCVLDKPSTKPKVPSTPTTARPATEAKAKLTAALEPVEAKVAAWDFAGAAAALENMAQPPTAVLAERLAATKTELSRLADLKKAIIARVKAAQPPLTKRALMLKGIGGTITDADDAGLTAKLPTGKTETFAWKDLGARSTYELFRRTIESDDAGASLHAGILLMRLGDTDHAVEFFAKAKAGGVAIERYLDPLAEAAFARAEALLKEVRGAETPRLQEEKLDVAEKALAELQAKYAKTAWMAAHKPDVEAAKKAIVEARADALYAQAKALYDAGRHFELKPVVEKLKADYPDSPAVKDAARRPSFAAMAERVASLGKRITVAQRGRADHKDVQSAINAAPPNSIIEILDGATYVSELVIPKEKAGLIVRGQPGRWPIIKRERKGKIITILAPDVTLEQFVVAGGGIDILATGKPRLRSVMVFGGSIGRISSGTSNQGIIMQQCLVAGNRLSGVRNLRSVTARDVMMLGGGIRQHQKGYSRITLKNVLARGVTAVNRVTIEQCTIREGISIGGGPSVVRDTICAEIKAEREGVTVKHSCVHGEGFQLLAKPGEGCIKGDPQFRDPKSHDFRLKPSSPCRKKASDGGDIGVRYTPEMIALLQKALELRKKGSIKF